jgi:hypothetical protein
MEDLIKATQGKFKINLQLHAPKNDNDNDDDTEENTEDEDANTEVQTEEVTEEEEEEDEDEEVKILRKKLKVMDQENVLGLNKMANMEQELAQTKKMMADMQLLLTKIADNSKPVKKKVVSRTSPEELADIASKQILLDEVTKLKNSVKERDERDFIKNQVSDKPWVSDTVKKLKIATENEYIRYILPIEDDLKEKEELRKRAVNSEERDLMSEYGLTIGNKGFDSKVNKIQQRARDLGKSIIDDVLS